MFLIYLLIGFCLHTTTHPHCHRTRGARVGYVKALYRGCFLALEPVDQKARLKSIDKVINENLLIEKTWLRLEKIRSIKLVEACTICTILLQL